MQSNMINWIEIPVNDMERAIQFYNHVFQLKLKSMGLGDEKMAWFPFDSKLPGISGSLVKHEKFYKPSPWGVVIYFSVDNIENTLEKVDKMGTEVIQRKKLISLEHGYMALFLDSEGNRIALHSKS